MGNISETLRAIPETLRAKKATRQTLRMNRIIEKADHYRGPVVYTEPNPPVCGTHQHTISILDIKTHQPTGFTIKHVHDDDTGNLVYWKLYHE